MTPGWRSIGLAALLLGSLPWAVAGGNNSGPGSGPSGGMSSGSSGMSRPMSIPLPQASTWPGSRPAPASNSGPGSGGKDASKDSIKDATRPDEVPKDGSSGRGRREETERREGDDRTTGPGPRPGGESPDGHWQRTERLLRAQPLVYERDPIGAPVLRSELTLLLPPDAELPPALARRGFIAVRESAVLGRRLVVLRTPADLTLDRAVALGRQLAPEAEIDFNHVLLGSGRAEPAKLPAAKLPQPAPAGAAAPVHVGLIDEAVAAADLAAWAELRPTGRRCAAPARAEGHGVAVATVLARSVRDAGRRPVLHAADLACGQGAVDAVASALQAMDAERVPVVNLSAVGPYNRVMAAVVAAFLARGHLLVAAVGNDGPAAAPLYPAAYPGVIAVTAVDRQGRVLVEAGRGEHVAFAALGVVELPSPESGTRSWRGTSLAAPVVAAALALRLPAPDGAAAQAAVAQLARSAADAGEPGRDRVYGHGVVGLPAPALAAAH
jgi:hypothetical protein